MSRQLRVGFAIAIALGLLTVDSVVEGGVRERAQAAAAQPVLSAQQMVRAVLGGTVEEELDGLATCGSSTAEPSASGWPQWLQEVMPALVRPASILVGGDSAAVSLSWPKEAFSQGEATARATESAGEHLAAALIECGWTGVESGMLGYASFVRGEGDEEWLLVSEWATAEGAVVLVQCV